MYFLILVMGRERRINFFLVDRAEQKMIGELMLNRLRDDSSLHSRFLLSHRLIQFQTFRCVRPLNVHGISLPIGSFYNKTKNKVMFKFKLFNFF